MRRESILDAVNVEDARRILRERRALRAQGSAEVVVSGTSELVGNTTKAVDTTLTPNLESVTGGVALSVASQSQHISNLGGPTATVVGNTVDQGANDRAFMIGGARFLSAPKPVRLPAESRISSDGGQNLPTHDQSQKIYTDITEGVVDEGGDSMPSDMSLPPDAWVGGTTDGLISEMQVAMARASRVYIQGTSVPASSDMETPLSAGEPDLPIEVDILILGEERGIVAQPTTADVLDEMLFSSEEPSDFVARLDKSRLIYKKGPEKYDSSSITVVLPHFPTEQELYFRGFYGSEKILRGKKGFIFRTKEGESYLISGNYDPMNGGMRFYPSKNNTSGPKEPFFGRIIGHPHY